MAKIQPIKSRASDKIQDPPEAEARVVELPKHYLQPFTDSQGNTQVSLPGRSMLVIDRDGIVHVKDSTDNPNFDPDSLSSGQLDSSTEINVGDSTLVISATNKYIAVGSDPATQGWILSEDGMAGYANGNERFRFFLTSSGSFGVGDVLIGDPSGHYVWWDQSAGKLIISGEINATTGKIGGWNIGTDSLYDDNSKIILKAAAVPYIQFIGAGDYWNASGIVFNYNNLPWKIWTYGILAFSYDDGTGYETYYHFGDAIFHIVPTQIQFGDAPDTITFSNNSGDLEIIFPITGDSLFPTVSGKYLGKNGKPWSRIYIGDSSGDGIYFGGTKRIYQSGTDILSVLATIDVSDNVVCTNLELGGGNNIIYGDGTHIEFNGVSNAHLVPNNSLINSAQLGTSTNYWYAVHYGSGGLRAHSTPLFGENKDIFSIFNKMRNTKDNKSIDKKSVDPELLGDNGNSIRMDKLIMSLVVAVRKLDKRLAKLETKFNKA